jgi:DNA-binding PadR family transcriptional regulator
VIQKCIYITSSTDISSDDNVGVRIMEEKMDIEIRRAFLKYIVLKIIKDKPTHGYDIIKTVELRSNGRWTPSAGSIYPILESLESNGFIQIEEVERRKVYTITPRGEVALDRMTQKKIELLNEMSRIINSVTEGNDNSSADVGVGAGNIQDEGRQPEATNESEPSNLKNDEDGR